VADGVITAYASARYSHPHGAQISPGEEIAFLGTLPCEALPMSPRTLGLLESVGVKHIADLQRLDLSSLIARFGREGERLYALARGIDPRRPRSSCVEQATGTHLALPAPCQTIEPLVFVLRGALDRLVEEQVERGRAVSRVRLTLHGEARRGEPGEEEVIEIAPSRPTTRSRLLLELIRLALSERLDEAVESEPRFVDALTLEILERAATTPRQGELFVERADDLAMLERVMIRLIGRLGAHAIGRPERVNTRHPDREGRWRAIEQLTDHDRQERVEPAGARTCYRRLETPQEVSFRAPDRLDLSALGAGEVRVCAWHGAERRAGSWWEERYDRDYRWAELDDGRVYRIYRKRDVGVWFIEGWMD